MKASATPLYGHPDAFPLTRLLAKGLYAADGDTVAAIVQTEPLRYVLLDLRLSTIDTYELHTGPAAWRALGVEAAAFSHARTADQWLRVISVLDTEKYGRTLTAVEYRTESGLWLDLAEQLDDMGYRKPAKSLTVTRRHELERDMHIMQHARLGLTVPPFR